MEKVLQLVRTRVVKEYVGKKEVNLKKLMDRVNDAFKT